MIEGAPGDGVGAGDLPPMMASDPVQDEPQLKKLVENTLKEKEKAPEQNDEQQDYGDDGGSDYDDY